MKELSDDKALMIISSEEPYPVDFDWAWRQLGYSSKQMAEKTLKSNFDEDFDFSIKGLKTAPVKGGRPSNNIVLTYDCFKMLGMMAGTAKGKEVRQYFLEKERQFFAAKKYLEQHAPAMKAQLKQAKNIIEQTNQGIDPFKYIKLLEDKIELLDEKAARLDAEINKPKKVFRRVTADEQTQIIDLWKTKKYTLNELSRKVGRGAATVRAELMAAGLYKPTTK